MRPYTQLDGLLQSYTQLDERSSHIRSLMNSVAKSHIHSLMDFLQSYTQLDELSSEVIYTA
jgi:hypothetical protein